MLAGTTAPRKLDISWPTQDFTKMLTSWDKYDETSMHITVKYIKAHELPRDVFEEGEQRIKVLKRPKSQANKNATVVDQPNKKRRASMVATPLANAAVSSPKSSPSTTTPAKISSNIAPATAKSSANKAVVVDGINGKQQNENRDHEGLKHEAIEKK